MAVAALARRGLRRLLSWRASRVWCRAAHVLAQVAAAWPLLRSLGAGCVGFQDTADTQQHRTCHSACSQHQTCLGMQLSIRHASACSQHQTCLGMQLSVRCATRHAAQRQTCHSACSPASDVPLGMQPASDVNVALLGVLLGRPHPKTQSPLLDLTALTPQPNWLLGLHLFRERDARETSLARKIACPR